MLTKNPTVIRGGRQTATSKLPAASASPTASPRSAPEKHKYQFVY